MELKKVGTSRPPDKQNRAYSPRQSIKRLKLRSLIRSEDFCRNLRCNKRIPTAILFKLREERPDEKQFYCLDCAKEMERGKSGFR